MTRRGMGRAERAAHRRSRVHLSYTGVCGTCARAGDGPSEMTGPHFDRDRVRGWVLRHVRLGHDAALTFTRVRVYGAAAGE